IPVLAVEKAIGLNNKAHKFTSIKQKIPNLNERKQKVNSKHTKSIINQMIKEPIIQAKEMAGKENSEELLALFIDIFGIDDQIKDDVVYRIKRTQNMTSLHEAS